ncbi:MAG: VWA domain-containing protein [Francisella sp.]
MTFHFLRPWWLIAIIPAILLTILLFKYSSRTNSWSKYCDSHLLDHLLVGNKLSSKRSLTPIIFLIIWLIAIFSLAGPTWKYKDIPVYQKNIARVIALDVSISMDTTDISPSRLERAKYKIFDILKHIKEGQIGMVVFSSEPFVVSPLTSDSNTIKNLVSVINSDIVPVQGNNIEKALTKSAQLIQQAGLQQGQIILITDSSPSTQAINKASQLAKQGIKTYVYAIGTPNGGIAKDENGNYIKDDKGNIQYFGIDLESLKNLANAGSGKLVTLTNNNNDIKTLLSDKQSDSIKKSQDKLANTFWQDEGLYFIWLVVILSAFLFRKGILEKICR